MNQNLPWIMKKDREAGRPPPIRTTKPGVRLADRVGLSPGPHPGRRRQRFTRPGLDTDRISFAIMLHTAHQLTATATGILPGGGPPDLAGAIGRAALAALLPA